MGTVLTLEPLNLNLLGNTMVLQFRGAVTTGKTVTQVPYPASLAPNSINDGVNALHALLHSTAGDVLVFAHSQGCQVVSRWLRAHANDNDRPDPTRVKFLLIGNPLRKYGGAGVGTREVDGRIGRATPTNTAYQVTDFKLRYDGWADAPNRPGVAAMANSLQDRWGINGSRAIHALGYRTASLNAPNRKTYKEGNTTFVMVPHPPLLPVPAFLLERSYRRPEK